MKAPSHKLPRLPIFTPHVVVCCGLNKRFVNDLARRYYELGCWRSAGKEISKEEGAMPLIPSSVLGVAEAVWTSSSDCSR